LEFWRRREAETLGEILANPRQGELFCSTEQLEGTDGIFSKKRVRNRVILPYEYDRLVFIEFGTAHFVSDTGKAEQGIASTVSIIGEIRRVDESQVTAYPLIMGGPTLDHQFNKELGPEALWLGYECYEVFPEDIDEFSSCRDRGDPGPDEWMPYMRATPEAAVKSKLCQILADLPKNDWAGEQADHFSVSVHLGGRRIPAAFLLKGPATFREMTPELLGKRADQIYRLASTPARLLVVQHCYTIGEAVRATLRAFAVAPHNPRWYCLIDGKDTYKILKAYGKL
jgi:hypothetical protein